MDLDNGFYHCRIEVWEYLTVIASGANLSSNSES